MKTLEDQLRAQQRRALPDSWKREILQNAAADLQAARPHEPVRQWLFPRPWCAGLAALWIITLTLHFLTPLSRDRAARSTFDIAQTASTTSWVMASPSLLQQSKFPYLDDVSFLY